jgi:hypothetical protein
MRERKLRKRKNWEIRRMEKFVGKVKFRKEELEK